MLNNKNKGFGFGGMPGFNNSKKRGSISRGDFDRDGVSNREDCQPMNFRKQGLRHALQERKLRKMEGDMAEGFARMPDDERLSAIREARKFVEERVAEEERVKRFREIAERSRQ